MLPPEDMILCLYHDRLRTDHPADLCQEEKATAAASPDTGGEAKADSRAAGPCQCLRPPPCHTEPSELREVVVTGRTDYQDTIGTSGARIMTEMLPYCQGRKAQKHH